MKAGKQLRKIAGYISFQMEKVSHEGEQWNTWPLQGPPRWRLSIRPRQARPLPPRCAFSNGRDARRSSGGCSSKPPRRLYPQPLRGTSHIRICDVAGRMDG